MNTIKVSFTISGYLSTFCEEIVVNNHQDMKEIRQILNDLITTVGLTGHVKKIFFMDTL